MSPARAKLITVLGTTLLMLTGCLMGALFAEAGYRAFLAYAYPERFALPERKGLIGVYNISHWEFDEQFGYVYPPKRVIDYTAVVNGRVGGCSRSSDINEYGNIGPQTRQFEDAELKIAVFGDSWAVSQAGGKTWPHLLQEILEERTGKKVAVMNFGRDAYGVLQIFDLAAAKITEWKPDIAILTFITDDITRARFWRTVIGEGDDQRVVTTLDPVKSPRDDRATDTYLLWASATYEWCQKMLKAKEPDDVLRRLIEKHRKLISRSGEYPLAASVWSPDHLFLLDRLLKGNPFWNVERRVPVGTNPRTGFQRYSDDPRFMENLAKIKASGVEWVLFHLAFYPEIKQNREYTLNRQETGLLESLEKGTGKQVLRTTDFVKMPVEQPERINASPDDYHPSLWGRRFYAEAVAEALFKEGILTQR